VCNKGDLELEFERGVEGDGDNIKWVLFLHDIYMPFIISGLLLEEKCCSLENS
jgi:hypothetical protein